MTTDLETTPLNPVDQTDAGFRPYNFLALDADDFERLSNALFAVAAPPEQTKGWTRATLMIKGADAGRDVALFDGETLVGGVQCKRLDSGMSLPAVIQELAKLILHSGSRDDLPDLGASVTYYLVLARDPASSVVGFFDQPGKTLAQRPGLVADAVVEVLSTYQTLKTAWPDVGAAQRVVSNTLASLAFVLVRPHDLTTWLATQPTIASRFFRQRVVVDNTALDPVLQALEALKSQTAGVSLLVDEDLKMIKDRIDGTPESHRLNLGLAATFGFPREMMTGDGFARRLEGISVLYQTLFEDFHDWLLALSDSRVEALHAYASLRVHPFALQVSRPFLAQAVADQISISWSGRTMSGMVSRVTGVTPAGTDEQRLSVIRSRIIGSGRAWLAKDYSALAGESEDVALKRKIITHLLDGIADEQAMEAAYDAGVAVLKPPLVEIADELRTLCRHRPSVFIGGADVLDSPDAMKRMISHATAPKRGPEGGSSSQG